MKQKVPITIHLEGSGVEDGSILIEDLIPALQGLSSAYGKIASSYSPNVTHKLRVDAFERGSFLVHLFTTAVENKETIDVASGLVQIGFGGGAVYKTIEYILKLVQAKKHIKNEPFTQQVNYNNSTVIIVNSENTSLEVPLDVYNLIKEKTIDTDLNKLVSVIDEENIDNLSVSYQVNDKIVKEKVTASEKRYFDIENRAVSQTQRTWITCRMNSLTKTTNRGQAYLSDGSRVSFKLASEHPEEMYQYFIHNGLVKVFCEAKLDENLRPVELEIFQIEKLQNSLDLNV